jgi:short-subunit dehydrogenase
MAKSPPEHVLITGGSSGIGAALARRYAHPGVMLSVLGRNRSRLDEVAQACRHSGAAVEATIGDVRDAGFMRDWLLRQDDLRPVDILIANAGLGGRSSMAGMDGENFAAARAIVETNFAGVVNSVLPLVPRLVARRAGRIALIGSVAGILGLPHCPVYSASKAAVRTYGDALRRLLRPHGISVTTVLPGFVDTPMSRDLPFMRPFLWDSERAGKAIARAIDRGRRELAFPWPLVMVAKLGSLLPKFIVDRVLSNSFERAAND